jgi:O-antigen biosynthesis protein
MLTPTKVVDIEVSQPIPTLRELDGYMSVQALVRWQGIPLGYVKLPISNGECPAATIGQVICEQQGWGILTQLLRQGLITGSPFDIKALEQRLADRPVDSTTLDPAEGLPLVTIAVCTRDRPVDLGICLDALIQLDYPRLDLLVIDNAPTGDTSKLVTQRYPQVRYVCEPRPGLDWARNRAILESQGEIIAYADDDVVVDSQWVRAIVQAFSNNPEVMAMTGLVVPYELETESQGWFEEYGGFGRGFQRKWHRVGRGQAMPHWYLGTGAYGTGANMAYRRSIFDEIGYFDPALDVGTVTNGGGDLEMFFRILKTGHTLLYEPNAVIRHRHRRDYDKFKTQITNNGVGLISYCMRTAMAYPEERRSVLKLLTWWILHWILIRAWVVFKYPARIPAELVKAEFLGGLQGVTRYSKAKRRAQEIAQTFTDESNAPQHPEHWPFQPIKPHFSQAGTGKVAVRSVDLSQPLQTVYDVQDYGRTHLFLSWQEVLLGKVDIVNDHQPISVMRLADAVIQELGVKLMAPLQLQSLDLAWNQFQARLREHLMPENPPPLYLPRHIPVSINITTYDRPDDLRNCLQGLMAQVSDRPLEIIVVDNHPASGLTPPVVAEFPSVKLVSEPRQGISYARNAGFLVATGEIVIATDDDVSPPVDWLEKLVAPFARPDVMVVTGNVLPLQLETPPQQFFEQYGGLGRGFNQFTVDRDWFDSFPRLPVPTWNLGATANAAFRRSIFRHPEIGLMEESLGAGMPAGVGEDTYVFYKVLKAGYTLWYEPSAYVWHKHRDSLKALRRQLYSYSRGHVAYHLITWLRDGDWRSWVQIFGILPAHHLTQINRWIWRKSYYPLGLTMLEIWGNLGGPWALWRSLRRVKRRGRHYPATGYPDTTNNLEPLPEILEASDPTPPA